MEYTDEDRRMPVWNTVMIGIYVLRSDLTRFLPFYIDSCQAVKSHNRITHQNSATVVPTPH